MTTNDDDRMITVHTFNRDEELADFLQMVSEEGWHVVYLGCHSEQITNGSWWLVWKLVVSKEAKIGEDARWEKELHDDIMQGASKEEGSDVRCIADAG